MRIPHPHITLGQHGPLHLQRCRLPLQSFDTHLYVVGRTRMGKSKFLQSILYQMITQGQGCGILDPHSDLCDDLIDQLAPLLYDDPGLRERIVYFQPGRDDVLVPFNVLKTTPEPYVAAQNVLEAMRRAWPESLREAPRFSNLVLASLLLLLEHQLTLLELPRLLTDPTWRNGLLDRTRNPEVLHFFRDRFDHWGRDRALMVESALNKVGVFAINPRLRLILGSLEDRLKLREIMDEGRVLLCDFGRVDTETRRLLGSLIVTGLEQEAFSRKDTVLGERRPFWFMMDEFQDYTANAGSSGTLARILAECRKFGLHLGLAHHSLSQIGDQALRGALENAQIRAIFSVGRETAGGLVPELYAPDLREVKHDVDDQARRAQIHPAYFPLGEQWEKQIQLVQRLPQRQALIQQPRSRQAVQIRTLDVPPRRLSTWQLEALKGALAAQSGHPIGELERELAERQTAVEEPPGVRYYEKIRT